MIPLIVSRRLLALGLVLGLVLGLAPGVSGELLSLGGGHCSHACCEGQDCCERSGGHEYAAANDPQAESLHGAHVDERPTAYVIAAVEPPSKSCRETCGVLSHARSKTVAPSRHRYLGTVQISRPAPLLAVLADPSNELKTQAPPRGPPPEQTPHL